MDLTPEQEEKLKNLSPEDRKKVLKAMGEIKDDNKKETQLDRIENLLAGMAKGLERPKDKNDNDTKKGFSLSGLVDDIFG